MAVRILKILAVWSMISVALIVVLPAASIPARAQPPIPPLPADLLFTTTSEEVGDYPRNVIARVDAQTLEVSPFYVDPEADEIIPISWSPQGDLLAVYRMLPAIDDAFTLFPRELCIVDRSGVLLRCLEDKPPMVCARDPHVWQQYYPVAWGIDGQTIFFDTEFANESSEYGYGKRLVEASVLTGQTLRVVYEHPDPFPIVLSSDLTHAAVGFGGPWIGHGAPAYLIDLGTGAQVDVPPLVPDLTTLSWACEPVSPGGNYVTVIAEYDVAAYAPELDPALYYGPANLLIVLDKQGAVQTIIGEPDDDLPPIGIECPGWQPDEQAFVFKGYGAERHYVLRYSLIDQDLTVLYEFGFDRLEDILHVTTPFIPSENGTHIALTVSQEYYGGNLQIAVLYPDGEIYRIPSPYRFGLYPLWVPE